MVMLMIYFSSLEDPAGVIFPSTLLHLALSFSLYSSKLCMIPYTYVLLSVISGTVFVCLQVCISLTDISELQDLQF